MVKDEEARPWTDAPEPFRERRRRRRSSTSARRLETPGIEGVVLRYGQFYGPGTYYASDGSIAEQVRRRRFPIVGRGEGMFSFIHIEDAASATVAAARPRGARHLQRRRRRAGAAARVAARLRGGAGRKAAAPGADAGWRGSSAGAVRGDLRDRAARRLERQGQARAGLGAALSELARRAFARRSDRLRRSHDHTDASPKAEGERRWLTRFPTFPTTTTRSSPTSTSRRCASTTTSTTRPTSTRRTRRSRAPNGRTPTSTRCSATSSTLPDDIRTPVRNNAGGHSNHSFFWQIMSPDGGGEPEGDLAAAIDEAFGCFDAFKDEFKNAGVEPLRLRLGVAGPRRLRPRGGLAPPTRTRRSPTARRRCSASTSGSTPTTSSTRTGAPTTSTPGGTSSTGREVGARRVRRSRAAERRRARSSSRARPAR